MSALDGRPHSASSTAVGDTEVVLVPGEAFRELMASNAALATAVAVRLTRELRRMMHQRVDLEAFDVPTRLAGSSSIAPAEAETHDDGAIELPISQHELAECVRRIAGGGHEGARHVPIPGLGPHRAPLDHRAGPRGAPRARILSTLPARAGKVPVPPVHPPSFAIPRRPTVASDERADEPLEGTRKGEPTMQAQTVQERSGTPWIALLLALIFAAAVVIGVQVAFKGRDVTVTNAPPSVLQSQLDPEQDAAGVQGLVDREATVPNQIDQAAALQKAGMSEAEIFGIGYVGDSPASSPHRGHQPMTAEQVGRAKELLSGPTSPNLVPTIDRIEAMKNGR